MGRRWLLLLGAHQRSFLHVVLTPVLLGYIESIILGEASRTSLSVSRFSQSMLVAVQL